MTLRLKGSQRVFLFRIMSDPSSDPQLDAQLRDVPLAEDFLDRLKASLAPSDSALDQRMRAVRVPSSLAARLHAIPDDVALDEQIADLPAPAGLVERLYAIPRERLVAYRRRSPARRAAEGAGLALSIVIGLAAALLLIVTGAYPRPGAQVQIADANPPSELPEIVVASSEYTTLVKKIVPEETICVIDVESNLASAPQWGDFGKSESSLVIDEATSDLLADGSDAQPSPVGEWTSLSHGGLRMMDDVVLLKFGVLGSPQYINDRLPELEAPWVPTARGVEPPLVRGYDRVFFLKNRVSPPISPGANPHLQTLAAPLSVDTSSFRRVWGQLNRGSASDFGEIRVEDFLAAIDYRFPSAPAGDLGLRTASGPSPFAAPGAGLLQVGVQAGAVKREKKQSSHLVLAIDASSSMGRRGRWTEVVYAVRRTLEQMTTDDHLSLVVVQDEYVQRWEDIQPSEAATIVRELERFQPTGGSNLSLGLQQAVSVALSQELAQTQQRRMVLISDDPTTIPATQRDAVRAMLLSSDEETSVGFDVIDMGEMERTAPLMQELTSALEGDYRRLSDGRAMNWLLLQRLTGQSSVVASEAKLTIRFNPKAVAAYRLVGHEANALAGLSPPSLEVEMHAADAASVLVELWLQPGDVDDVGEAMVTWVDPLTSQSRKRTQRISRLQFAPTFMESAPSLQAAAIAAETAELLRGSREAIRQANPAQPKPSWDTILATAGEANPVLDGWADYRRMLQLVERAKELKP